MSRRLVQVRYNLGSLKVQLEDDTTTVRAFINKLCASHKLPVEGIILTRDQRNIDVISTENESTLEEMGIRPGMTVYLAGRYEKKKVPHAYIQNGELISAGEQIYKCPEDEKEKDTDGRHLKEDIPCSSEVAPVHATNPEMLEPDVAAENNTSIVAVNASSISSDPSFLQREFSSEHVHQNPPLVTNSLSPEVRLIWDDIYGIVCTSHKHCCSIGEAT